MTTTRIAERGARRAQREAADESQASPRRRSTSAQKPTSANHTGERHGRRRSATTEGEQDEHRQMAAITQRQLSAHGDCPGAIASTARRTPAETRATPQTRRDVAARQAGCHQPQAAASKSAAPTSAQRRPTRNARAGERAGRAALMRAALPCAERRTARRCRPAATRSAASTEPTTSADHIWIDWL